MTFSKVSHINIWSWCSPVYHPGSSQCSSGWLSSPQLRTHSSRCEFLKRLNFIPIHIFYCKIYFTTDTFLTFLRKLASNLIHIFFKQDVLFWHIFHDHRLLQSYVNVHYIQCWSHQRGQRMGMRIGFGICVFWQEHMLDILSADLTREVKVWEWELDLKYVCFDRNKC